MPSLVVAGLGMRHAVNILWRQPTIANELTSLPERQQSQPEPMLAVEPLVPRDPCERFVSALRAQVVAHDVGIAQQRCRAVQVGGHCLPESCRVVGSGAVIWCQALGDGGGGEDLTESLADAAVGTLTGRPSRSAHSRSRKRPPCQVSICGSAARGCQASRSTSRFLR